MARTVAIGIQDFETVITGGYLKVLFVDDTGGFGGHAKSAYNGFIKALLEDNRKLMNVYMNEVALKTISYFDSGNRPAKSEPERFYHGFVLGLLVDLRDRYIVTSNRESGYGRYDIMLEPKVMQQPLTGNDAVTNNSIKNDAIIMEFKVFDSDEEETLQDTVQSALRQIEEKAYAQALEAKGIPKGRIRRYGFAFQGKTVLIG